MMSEISFSIVIPTYNREKFIVNTLESVFSQTYKNYEVIVVDNCSTDNTEQVLQPFIKANKIRFIKHERNYERARSRNTGMENAKGDFLTFLDSDDFMYPNCLADAADFVEKNPNIKCFQNLYELVNERKEVIYTYELPPIENRIQAIANGNFMSCIGDFIHREIYTKYRFDTFRDLTGVEDWEFWLQVVADYEVGRINKVNCGVLQHGERSVQLQNIESLERGYQHLIKKYREDEHLSKIYAKYLKRIAANSYLYLATLANMGAIFDKTKYFLQIARQNDSSVVFTTRYIKIHLRALLKKQIK
jgi:glycosyltransferase involved in cell wall biosynthesis